MMPNFKPRLGTKFQVQTAPVNDGQFIVATDSRELFYDNGTLRIPLADIVFLNTVQSGRSSTTIRLMKTLCRRQEAFRLFCSSSMARSVP